MGTTVSASRLCASRYGTSGPSSRMTPTVAALDITTPMFARYGAKRREDYPVASCDSRANSSTRALLHADRDSVFDLGNTRRRPCRPFRLLPLGPRLYRAAQDDFATVSLHGNATRIDLGAASEG